jgi:hypothetical protein
VGVVSAPALQMAERIEAAHQAAIGAARTAIEHAIECGKLLLEAKAQIGHGGWLAWVDANLSFGHRQAQKYTRLAEFSTKVPNANSNSHLTIDGALAAIAEPAQKPSRPKAKPLNPKEQEKKPVNRPDLVGAVRDLNVAWSPREIETATSVMTEEQRADLRQHLPDVIGKLQRLAVPPTADPADGDDGVRPDPVKIAEHLCEQYEASELAELVKQLAEFLPNNPSHRPPSRPTRWGDACTRATEALEELQELQAEYQDWRDRLPENMEGSATSEKLDAIIDLDIESAIGIVQDAEGADLPRGFGRD